MMLDSSLGKILSTKTVEPSIKTDVDSIATTVSEDASISSIKDMSVTKTAKSEAEVRLVVRFLVEEHIVFNGKVEQVKHLDRTELSRLVSRIAWDGTSEQEKVAETNNDSTNHLLKNTDDCYNSIDETPLPQTNSPTKNQIEIFKSIEDLSTRVVQKSIQLGDNDVPSGPDMVVSENVNPKIDIDGVHHFVECTTDNNNIECDTETTSFKANHTCENASKSPRSSYEVPVDIRKECTVENRIINSRSVNNQTGQIEKIDDGYIVESQMIVDTINDCVLNVDFESRYNEQVIGFTNSELIKLEEVDEEKQLIKQNKNMQLN